MDDIPETKPEKSDSLHNWIAVSVAILAAFMAVTKVKDDNIVQAMVLAKSDAVDTWAEYQSKRIKQHLSELGRDQARLLRLSARSEAFGAIDAAIAHYESDVARYLKEEAELKDKAKEKERLYDELNFKDDQFDLSDAALSVALALFAVTALTNRRWLLAVSWVFAAFGAVMGTAGLLGLGLHPGWLARLLS